MFSSFVFPLLLLFSFYDMPSDAQKKKEVRFTFFVMNSKRSIVTQRIRLYIPDIDYFQLLHIRARPCVVNI